MEASKWQLFDLVDPELAAHPLRTLRLFEDGMMIRIWNVPYHAACRPAYEIINKYLDAPKQERDILMCQDELIEAGLERWARL